MWTGLPTGCPSPRLWLCHSEAFWFFVLILGRCMGTTKGSSESGTNVSTTRSSFSIMRPGFHERALVICSEFYNYGPLKSRALAHSCSKYFVYAHKGMKRIRQRLRSQQPQGSSCYRGSDTLFFLLRHQACMRCIYTHAGKYSYT